MKVSAAHRFAVFLTAMTALLIFAGGLVTSTDSGLSVPDWPLSYGSIMPPMIGGIRFEHTHRLIAGAVGLLTVALAVLVWISEDRKWLKRLGLVAVAAVVTQAVLGGLTVIYLLPTWISVTHACLAQTFLCLIGSIAVVTGREWRTSERIEALYAPSIHRLLAATVTFVYLQLIAGAIVRHAHFGLRYHVFIAFMIVMHAVFVNLKVSREPRVSAALSGHAAILGLLIIVQIFLGLGSFAFTRMIPHDLPTVGEVLFTTVHQTTGALILLTSWLLALRSFRLLRRAESPAHEAGAVAGSVS